MVQLGYAAAASAGLTPSGPAGTLSRADVASLVQMYLANVTAVVRDLGFPVNKLFVHLGGTMVDKTCQAPDPGRCDKDASTPHVPFSAGMSGPDPLTSSTLGVSVYARPPQQQPTLAIDLQNVQPRGGMRWASVEWGLGVFWAPPGMPHGVDSWVAAYNTTLSFGDCRLLAFYNWSPTSTDSNTKWSIAAAKLMLASWTPPRGSQAALS